MAEQSRARQARGDRRAAADGRRDARPRLLRYWLVIPFVLAVGALVWWLFGGSL